MHKQPTFGNGKICYLEIPSRNIAESAAFYTTVFGWQIREDSDGHCSFDDGVGEVSGMWIKDRQPVDGKSLMVSIMVDNMENTLPLITSNGGEIIPDPSNPSGKTYLFKDPSGNLFSLYQHGG